MKTIKTSFPILMITLAGLFVAGGLQKATAQDGVSKGKPAVTLTEYGDFQCPACGYYYQMVEKLRDEFGDRLQVEFHHFPLKMHPYAPLASRAAEAARNQGKFWEMYDLLYKNQATWSQGNAQATFIGYARQLNLDMDKFKDQLNSSELQRRIMTEKEQGIKKGINSTPTFFLDGMEINNPRTYSEFKQLIESKLKNTD